MNKNILSQDYYEDTISRKLVEELEEIFVGQEGVRLFYKYPLIMELDEQVRYPSVLVISPMHGVIIFKCTEITRDRLDGELNDICEEAAWIEDYLFSKFIKSSNKELKSGRRNLSFNLISVVYAPNLLENIEEEIDILRTNREIKEYFCKNKQEQINENIINQISAIIEGSTGIVKPKERYIDKEDTGSKAYILKKLEEEIAIFDEKQKYAALSQLEGPQRIRGLAGSGKTIILAMKAAILHLKYPNKRILYTFMTKSLYDYIELLITRFYKVLGDGRLPDFDERIHVLHAWGGENVRGVYYDCCKRENIIPINFRDAVNVVGRGDAFDFICTDIMVKKAGRFEQYYDFVLIDEGQDFKPSFYQLCRAIVKNDCIVWGYDELQNIFNVNIQDTVHTFENEYGYEGINLPILQQRYPEMENDIVLEKSYRNPKEILVLAHAIGFGIYNETLIQSLENNDHWGDLGYEVKEGNCQDGDQMIIIRPNENSPLSVSNMQSIDDIIQYYSALNIDNEVEWVAHEIEKAIKQDKLRPDDIMVISLDDRYAKRYFNALGELLYTKGIWTNNLTANTYKKGFYEEKCVTLTTLYKAKGNESPMVFVMGCDVIESSKNTRSMRNKIFTAFTRAKAWLRVSGWNIEGDSIIREIEDVKKNNFELRFVNKDAKIIKRDLDDINKNKTKEREKIQNDIKKAKELGLSRQEISQMIEAEYGEYK